MNTREQIIEIVAEALHGDRISFCNLTWDRKKHWQKKAIRAVDAIERTGLQITPQAGEAADIDQRARGLLDLLKSDFCQSDEWAQLEAIRCELYALARPVAPVWTQGRPTAVGKYFRNNPACSHIVTGFIYEIDGVLKMANNQDSIIGRPVDTLPDNWWWFGPIPPLPSPPDSPGATEANT